MANPPVLPRVGADPESLVAADNANKSLLKLQLLRAARQEQLDKVNQEVAQQQPVVEESRAAVERAEAQLAAAREKLKADEIKIGVSEGIAQQNMDALDAKIGIQTHLLNLEQNYVCFKMFEEQVNWKYSEFLIKPRNDLDIKHLRMRYESWTQIVNDSARIMPGKEEFREVLEKNQTALNKVGRIFDIMKNLLAAQQNALAVPPDNEQVNQQQDAQNDPPPRVLRNRK